MNRKSDSTVPCGALVLLTSISGWLPCRCKLGALVLVSGDISCPAELMGVGGVNSFACSRAMNVSL